MRLAIYALVLMVLAGTVEASAQSLHWGKIRIVSDPEAPADTTDWVEALALEGEPVAQASLEQAILAGLERLSKRGFPFARARPGVFDLEDDRLTATITVDSGIQARIAGVALSGAEVTRPRTALRISGIKLGQAFTGEEDRRLREHLLRSGLFSSVGEVLLLPGSEPEAVLLSVPVTEPPYTRFRGVLGVSGRESRLTGLVDLDLANIAGTAREGAGRWESRGDGLTRFALRYREPWLPFVPVGVEGDLAHDVNEETYSYTRWEVAGDVKWGGQWRVRLGRGGTRAVQTAVGSGKETESFTLAGVDLERRNSVLNPTSGYRAFLESRRGKKTLVPFGDSLEVRHDRTRWNLGAEGYQPVGREWVAVLKTQFLYLDTPEDSIPRWDLFAVGGAVSLRGYREEQFLTPGAWLVQTEWRRLQGDRGSAVYLFADAGFVSPAQGRGLRDTFRQFLLGVGLGVRQATRLGILGVEYGIAKGESPLDGRIHLRVDAVF